MMSFEEIQQTFIEAWPRDLRQISVPGLGLHLTLDEARTLGLSQIDYWETWTEDPSVAMPSLDVIAEKLEREFELLDNPGFVRLGSRSPKDAELWYRLGPRVRNADEALALLCSSSERVNDDLHWCVMNDYAPWIWIREWMDIAPHEEFRCFVSNRRVEGISQYWYDKTYEQINTRADELKRVTTTFLDYEVCPSLHLDQAVVDLAVQESDGRWKITLIEVNPYDETLTDPCLLPWGNPRTGQFAYRDRNGDVTCQ